jgi:hypothetical protein
MVRLLLRVFLLLIPASLFADSHAYVVASGSDYTTPGSITPFNVAKGTAGAAFFVPIGGYIIAVPPGSRQIWQAVCGLYGCGSGPYAINVLNTSGNVLASIQLETSISSLVFDAPGRYAYISLTDGRLAKINVASRTIVQTVSPGVYGQLALSSDGSKLFLGSYYPGVAVFNTQPLRGAGFIPQAALYSIFVFGDTLLVTDATELYYYDTNTLQQTQSSVVPADSVLFGVSPDGSKIYMTSQCCGSPGTMAIVDFASGQVLVTQTSFPVAVYNAASLSPDGSEVVVASSAVLLLDPQTLATKKTTWTVGGGSAAYLGSQTLLILHTQTGVMMVVDQASARVTASFPLGLNPSGEVADTNRGLVYVGCNPDFAGTPSVVSTKLNRIVANLDDFYGFVPTALAGQQLYGVNLGETEVYNLATGAYAPLPPPVTVPPYEYWTSARGAAPPNGKTYWEPFKVFNSVSVIWSGVAVYSTATNALLARIALPTAYAPSVFSPDSASAYIGGPNVIMVYSTSTLQRIATFNYTTTFTALAISPDGTLLYATDGSTIYVINAATGAQQQTFPAPLGAVAGAMAISPDGTALFFLEADFFPGGNNTVNFVDTTNGQITQVRVPYPPTSIVVLP